MSSFSVRRLLPALLLLSLPLSACGGDEEKPFSEEALIAKVRPSVVQITGRVGDSATGGTGFVIDEKQGLVLTNAHVVAGTSALRAKVGDRADTEGPVRVVAQAPCEDLAVVKFAELPSDLTALPFGDSKAVKLGQHVTALGYPASLENPDKQRIVATDGTVSSVDVEAEPDTSLPKYSSTIQHQAPVNPGNSGGPLVDDEGRVIGVNTLANTKQNDRAIQGQYYAITTNHAKRFLPALRAGKSTADVGWNLVPLSAVPIAEVFASDTSWKPNGRAALGARTQAQIEAEGLEGLFVLDSKTGSAAANAEIIFGDMVRSIEGASVTSVQDVCDIIESKAPGDSIKVRGNYINSAKDVDQVLRRWTATVKLQ